MGYLMSHPLGNNALKPFLGYVPALAFVTLCQSPAIGRHGDGIAAFLPHHLPWFAFPPSWLLVYISSCYSYQV